MSGEAKYTEREMVYAKRIAFYDGAAWAGEGLDIREQYETMDEGEKRYPLPVVPRVVTDPIDNSFEWSVVDGELRFRRQPSTMWHHDIGAWTPSPDRIRLWADLLASPNQAAAADPGVSS